MKKMFIIFLSILLTNNVIAAQEKSLNVVCPIQKQYVCFSEKCVENHPSVTIKVQQDESGQAHYSRCDKKGCDKYDASVSQPGAYIEIVSTSISSRLKIYSEDGGHKSLTNDQDMSFMETSSLGLAAYIGFGKCQKVLHP